MVLIILRITRVIIWAIEVHLRVIYHDSWISFIMQFILSPAGLGWRFMQGCLTWFVCWMGLWPAVVPRESWWAPVWRQSAIRDVTVGTISTGMRALWSTPMMTSIVSMMWPGIPSVGIMVTVAVVSMGMGLWPWSAVSVPVLVMVTRNQSGAVPGMGFWSVLMCRCTWEWYLVQTVHYYMSIFITFEAANI